MVHKVNLAAAFHDHISCTKAGGNLNSLIAFHQVNNNEAKKNVSSACDSLLIDSIVVEDGDRSDDSNNDEEQIARLKSMILVQLDLIQYQQEQLLKKDRQLQGLKQDREALCLRLEKMEQRITYLTSKLANVNENSTEESETIVDSKDSTETNDSLETFSSVLNDSSSVFARIFSNNCNNNTSTPTSSITNTVSQSNVSSSSSQTVSVNKSEPSSSASQTNTVCDRVTSQESDDRSPKKRTSVTRESFSSSSAKKKRLSKSVVDSESKLNLVNSINQNETNKMKSIGKRRKVNGKLKKYDQEVNETVNHSKTLNSNLSIMETDSVYDIVMNRELIGEDGEIESCDVNKNESTLIEVPSWRLHPITSCYSLEGTENLDDEVFARRHAKLESDERRRKRWDMQRMREQKNNERLRSGRYYSPPFFGDKQSETKKTPDVISFFPEPKDRKHRFSSFKFFVIKTNHTAFKSTVHFIEVCDKLPFVAFGHSIPRLTER
ncbi:male-specific lethal 1-like protein [Dinothrombium tinctorium]|uniref:Male-specific lethal 1-like protein n=1 Tax=Dinothrombium tinctorium TaxID=1965070 RepID=A0A3S3PUG4_9ACAR|nr:male-specific lethal 1-like protein [Dinothrombium tinctorium]RWS07091.1 male-specific lethal 1-like protein [Dinothrombium tinctorium]RWS08371.1 male-specific lethal 1-like protein [Dinothrombium tinctorium]